MAGPRYDTVLERCHPQTETVLMSFIRQNMLESDAKLQNGVDDARLAQVQEVIETAVTGRKYEVLLLRSQGKSMAEIAMMLSVSKSTVQNYYRQAVRQVRQALGLEGARRPAGKSKKPPAESVTV